MMTLPAALVRTRACLLLAVPLVAAPLRGWDHPGHMLVNQGALASLPATFPSFVRNAGNTDRIIFLSGEPDRWSHAVDLPIRHKEWLDHFCDLEQVTDAGLTFATISSLRYDFMLAFAGGRAGHSEKFPAIEAKKNTDHTQQWPGFLPWTVAENYGRLKATFAAWKAYEELGTAEEKANAQANVVYLMGVLGHYVGDCAQPLHTTNNYNGWVGQNPNQYTTSTKFHSWADSGFLAKAGMGPGTFALNMAPAQPISLAARTDGRDPVFVAVLEFLLRQYELVEPLYQLEKAGKLGLDQQPVTNEARVFFERRLQEGGGMLGRLWLTAWQAAAPDAYLRGILLKRRAAAGGARPAR